MFVPVLPPRGRLGLMAITFQLQLNEMNGDMSFRNRIVVKFAAFHFIWVTFFLRYMKLVKKDGTELYNQRENKAK